MRGVRRGRGASGWRPQRTAPASGRDGRTWRAISGPVHACSGGRVGTQHRRLPCFAAARGSSSSDFATWNAPVAVRPGPSGSSLPVPRFTPSIGSCRRQRLFSNVRLDIFKRSFDNNYRRQITKIWCDLGRPGTLTGINLEELLPPGRPDRGQCDGEGRGAAVCFPDFVRAEPGYRSPASPCRRPQASLHQRRISPKSCALRSA